MTAPDRTAANPRWFRRVLGTYPTGVCVITATHPDSSPVGMAVGSFTSVSLDPPLVGFLPDHASTSWPKIRAAGRFCVNILGADQEQVCRAFAAKAADKFAGVGWRAGPGGSPVLDGAVAWIDWLARVPAPLSQEQAGAWRAALDRVRRQGYWVRLGGPPPWEFDARIARLSAIADSRRRRSVFHELFEPELTDEYAQLELALGRQHEVRAMSAPVLDAEGRLRFSLILFGLPPRMSGTDIAHWAARLRAACAAAGKGTITAGGS